jgi:hypothetical protein
MATKFLWRRFKITWQERCFSCLSFCGAAAHIWPRPPPVEASKPHTIRHTRGRAPLTKWSAGEHPRYRRYSNLQSQQSSWSRSTPETVRPPSSTQHHLLSFISVFTYVFIHIYLFCVLTLITFPSIGLFTRVCTYLFTYQSCKLCDVTAVQIVKTYQHFGRTQWLSIFRRED